MSDMSNAKRLAADLADLQTMLRAKMSPASISRALRRSVAWVETQIELLTVIDGREARQMGAGLVRIVEAMPAWNRRAGKTVYLASRIATGRPSRRREALGPDAPVGLVYRSFLTWTGGHGACVSIGGGATAFVVTPAKVQAGARIKVALVDGVWAALPAKGESAA